MPAFNQGRLLKKRSLNENFIKIGCRSGTYSMVITRSGIKKILDFNINYGIFLPYDNEIAFIPDIQLYCLKWSLVTHPKKNNSDTIHRHL